MQLTPEYHARGARFYIEQARENQVRHNDIIATASSAYSAREAARLIPEDTAVQAEIAAMLGWLDSVALHVLLEREGG